MTSFRSSVAFTLPDSRPVLFRALPAVKHFSTATELSYRHIAACITAEERQGGVRPLAPEVHRPVKKRSFLCLPRKKHILFPPDIGIDYQMVEFSVICVLAIAGFTQGSVASASFANGKTMAWC